MGKYPNRSEDSISQKCWTRERSVYLCSVETLEQKKNWLKFINLFLQKYFIFLLCFAYINFTTVLNVLPPHLKFKRLSLLGLVSSLGCPCICKIQIMLVNEYLKALQKLLEVSHFDKREIEAATGDFLQNRCFFKILQYPQEHTCVGVSF